ncbi:MAG: O-antigen ligase family protein, partial [Thermodesulfovibrionales bacterium]|nr:O-antigen ligase family protein [Thermodesulfovibrionales bacterium]
VFVGWFGWDPVIDRFGSVVGEDGSIQFNRTFIWTDAIRIIKDSPVLGTGFGSFGSIYPSYRTMPGGLVVDHAHNDFLELVVEGGLLSLALAAWFVLTVLIRVLGTIKVRRENYSIIMGIAGASAMMYMLVHSFVDFNMHIGSNALYFFFIAAFAVSASHTRLRKGRRSSLLKKQPLVGKKVLVYPVLAACACIIFVNVLVLSGSLAARGLGSVAHETGSSIEDLEQARKSYTLATYLDPFNSGYHAALARTDMALGGSGLKEYSDAIKDFPLDARVLQAAARAFGYAGDDKKADALMRASLVYGARHHDPYLRYVQWLLSRGSYQRAEEVARKGITLEPASTPGYVRIFINAGFSGPEVMGILPDKSAAHVRLARYFMKQGREFLADDTYWRALDLMAGDDSLTYWDYGPMFTHFFGKGRFDAARAVAEDAVENFPGQFWSRVWLGSAHERTGNVEMARQEYEKALSLDPGNIRIVRRLESLSGKSQSNVVK